MTDRLIDARTKGLPPLPDGMALSGIAGRGWNVLREDLPLPLAVLRESALQNNSRWMRDFVQRTGAKFAPHGKTTMSPQLFARQIADGAWGLTLSTVQQAKVARAAGVRRILIANEIVGRQEIAALLELQRDPAVEIFCLIDSVEGVRRLASAAAAAPFACTLNLLLEMGYAGGRCGCRDLDAALAVARAVVAAAPHLRLRGVEGYEGLHQHLAAAEGEARVAEFLTAMVAAAERLDAEGLLGDQPIILSAGGSAFYDMVMDVLTGARLARPPEVILRSGCYLTHDAGIYEDSFDQILQRSSVARAVPGRFENALEVWAYVISVPEPRRAILGAGRRDFGHDASMPKALKLFRPGRDATPGTPPPCEIVSINDQHAHVVIAEGADITVGDMVALGVSHPCTTFDKWRYLMTVDDDYTVQSAIETCF
jgi:D-serine dehydratase